MGVCFLRKLAAGILCVILFTGIWFANLIPMFQDYSSFEEDLPYETVRIEYQNENAQPITINLSLASCANEMTLEGQAPMIYENENEALKLDDNTLKFCSDSKSQLPTESISQENGLSLFFTQDGLPVGRFILAGAAVLCAGLTINFVVSKVKNHHR